MVTSEQIACLYKAEDIDSFVGAWCLWMTYPNAGFHTQFDHSSLSHIGGKRVYVMGSVLSLAQVCEVARYAESVTVFEFEDSFQREVAAHGGQIPDNLTVVFDTERSVAGLAWDFFSHHQERSPVINYIEDQRLWRYSYPETRAVMAALGSQHQSFEVWRQIIMEADISLLVEEGKQYLKRLVKDVERTIMMTRRRINLGGYDVPAVNSNPTLALDAGIQIAKGEPFGVSYWDTPQGRVFELVSVGDGVDVGEFASSYGGTGTRRVAQFAVPRGHPLCVA